MQQTPQWQYDERKFAGVNFAEIMLTDLWRGISMSEIKSKSRAVKLVMEPL